VLGFLVKLEDRYFVSEHPVNAAVEAWARDCVIDGAGCYDRESHLTAVEDSVKEGNFSLVFARVSRTEKGHHSDNCWRVVDPHSHQQGEGEADLEAAPGRDWQKVSDGHQEDPDHEFGFE